MNKLSVFALVVFGLSFLIVYSMDCKDNLLGYGVDVYGCRVSAGYSYNESVGACIREWELNLSQRVAAASLIKDVNIKNATIVSVLSSEDITTVYEVVLTYDNQFRTFFVDKRGEVDTINKKFGGCNDGYEFCLFTGSCINISEEVCGNNNITIDNCNFLFNGTVGECSSNEVALANVNGRFCCVKKDFVVILPSSDVCADVCEVFGFSDGDCSSNCINCVMAGRCVDGGACMCFD